MDGDSIELHFTQAANKGDSFLSPDDRLLLSSSGDLIDTGTGETVFVFPAGVSPQFNGDWSQAAYWLNTTLVLVDIDAGTERKLTSLENNLGLLEAVNPTVEVALFRGDEFDNAYL